MSDTLLTLRKKLESLTLYMGTIHELVINERKVDWNTEGSTSIESFPINSGSIIRITPKFHVFVKGENEEQQKIYIEDSAPLSELVAKLNKSIPVMLIYEGRELKDEETIQSYSINLASTISMAPPPDLITIFVQDQFNEQQEIYIRRSDTVEMLRRKFQKRSLSEQGEYDLIFNDQVINDHFKSIESYGMDQGSVISVISFGTEDTSISYCDETMEDFSFNYMMANLDYYSEDEYLCWSEDVGTRGAIISTNEVVEKMESTCFNKDNDFIVEPFVIELHMDQRFETQ